MFNNLENKLKVFGWIEFVGAFILVILYGISECTVQVGYSDTEFKFGMFLGYLAGGFVGSWLVAIPYFVFAQLIENSQICISQSAEIRERMRELQQIRRLIEKCSVTKATPEIPSTELSQDVETIAEPVEELEQENKDSDTDSVAEMVVEIFDAKKLVNNALLFTSAEGCIGYVKAHYNELSDDEKQVIASVECYIDNGDAEALKSELVNLRNKLD